uniref:GH18 domain-containing protein n=1 Tax=Cuerna arida TaxID=1464854 RepID=A0A1B6GSI8_9HEMI
MFVSLTVVLISALCLASGQKPLFGSQSPFPRKTVCFFNAKNAHRLNLQTSDLMEAARFCNFLVYGYATVDFDDHKIRAGDEDLDIKRDNFRAVTDLRLRNRGLKVLLSVGGYMNDDTETYMKILEDTDHREKLVKSAVRLVNEFNFDGLDLAWRFPMIKVSKNRSLIGSFWHKTKKVFGAHDYKDDRIDEHRDQFTALVRRLKDKLGSKMLTITQLPNVNASSYFDIKLLDNYVDQVHLMAFDFHAANRYKYVADHSNPLYPLSGRNSQECVDSVVRHWVHHNIPKDKLVLIVSSHANAWVIADNKKDDWGYPPLEAESPTTPTEITNMAGFYAYHEICKRLRTEGLDKKSPASYLKKYSDSSANALYAYRSPVSSEDSYGVWASYEDTESVKAKRKYVVDNLLGGIGISDLSDDDFSGSCPGSKKFHLLQSLGHDLHFVV